VRVRVPGSAVGEGSPQRNRRYGTCGVVREGFRAPPRTLLLEASRERDGVVRAGVDVADDGLVVQS